MPVEILHRDDLVRGGFAGLREHRLVMDPRVFGKRVNPETWGGIGNFVYLADARFMPKGETGLHPHRELDVISVMVEGRIAHGGSLEDGEQLLADEVQVQSAGGEGFEHNEVNPDDAENRMLQLWVLPERAGQSASYKLYKPKRGSGLTRIYGGPPAQNETIASQTVIDVGLLETGEIVKTEGPFMAYVSRGKGAANGVEVADGDLFRADSLEFEAHSESQLIVIGRLS